MAIRVEFYRLITPVHIAKQYFPGQYAEKWCWNDGAICTPMGAMNPCDISNIIRECEDLGLKKFREGNGERIIGDYYIGMQFGFDDTSLYKKSDWVRVYHDVAWNPSFPLGKRIPDKFPCFHGGFYYESEKVWEEAGLALDAFNEALDEYEPKPLSGKEEDLLFDMPRTTPYDNFFNRLAMRTLEREIFGDKKLHNL